MSHLDRLLTKKTKQAPKKDPKIRHVLLKMSPPVIDAFKRECKMHETSMTKCVEAMILDFVATQNRKAEELKRALALPQESNNVALNS